jgi:hypothetical protein
VVGVDGGIAVRVAGGAAVGVAGGVAVGVAGGVAVGVAGGIAVRVAGGIGGVAGRIGGVASGGARDIVSLSKVELSRSYRAIVIISLILIRARLISLSVYL